MSDTVIHYSYLLKTDACAPMRAKFIKYFGDKVILNRENLSKWPYKSHLASLLINLCTSDWKARWDHQYMDRSFLTNPNLLELAKYLGLKGEPFYKWLYINWRIVVFREITHSRLASALTRLPQERLINAVLEVASKRRRKVYK